MEPVKKFRASFSVLSTWEKGDWQGALSQYFWLPTIETEAMREGKRYHKDWNGEIIRTKLMPAVFGAAELSKDFKTELKLEVDLADWLEVVCKIDLLDGPTIHEFKTGVGSSGDGSHSKQGNLYGLLAVKSGFAVKECKIWHYNQYNQKSDLSIVWLTPATMERAQNWVETLAGEMREYINNNLEAIDKVVSAAKRK